MSTVQNYLIRRNGAEIISADIVQPDIAFYAVHETPLGTLGLVQAPPWGTLGVCFGDDNTLAEHISVLKKTFPHTTFMASRSDTQPFLQGILSRERADFLAAGSPFQVKVWQTLIQRTNVGQKITYQDLATFLGHPHGTQSVGNALKANPIAWLIPCHRVIQKNGEIGGFRWGATQKQHLLSKELSQPLPSSLFAQ